MKLKAEEKMLVENLLTQEELCTEKYKFYAKQAKDPQLKELFEKIGKNERQHCDLLTNLKDGRLPERIEKEAKAEKYEPSGQYKGSAADKKQDCFLCTDSIATEKYVASAYNNDLFRFAAVEARNLLNSIETDEQNHAEMIYLYKSANQMV